MNRGTRRVVLVVGLLLGLLLVGLAADELGGFLGPDAARVTFVDESGRTLGTLDVTVVDTFRERYVGLSDTEALGPNEGMLFVHDEEAVQAYVMRDMAFPIDIVFVGGDRRISAIHTAPVEEPPLTRYTAPAKWVVETPVNWSARHGVTAGDRVRIDWGIVS